MDGSSIAILDQEPLPKSALPPKNGQGQGPEGDVALTRLSSGAILVANRKGSSVELSRWSMDGGGALSLLDSGIKMGPAETMDLQPVYGDMFLTTATDPEGDLVVKSWQLDGSSLVHLDTYRDESREYSEVAAAGPLTTDVFNGHRAVTASIAPGQLVHDVWGVDETTGEISLLGELAQASTREAVEISPFFVNTTFEGEPFPPVYYATVARGGGNAVIRFYRITAPGAPVDAGLATTGIAMEEAGLAPLGTAWPPGGDPHPRRRRRAARVRRLPERERLHCRRRRLAAHGAGLPDRSISRGCRRRTRRVITRPESRIR